MVLAEVCVVYSQDISLVKLMEKCFKWVLESSSRAAFLVHFQCFF